VRGVLHAKGWKVGAVFQERGITGTGEKDRPQWRKLMVAVEGGEVDAVVVFAISRAARNTIDLLRSQRRAHDRTKVPEPPERSPSS
jgi:site-specific DNA recombinase